MQLYWLRQSVPELANLPTKVRWRVYLNALRRSPWLVIAFVLLHSCFYLASFVLTLLIVHDLIVDGVIGDHGYLVNILAITGISGFVAFVPEWLVCRPILFHFLRPKIRMLREADEV